MDRQLHDAAEHRPNCSAPVNSLYNDVNNVDGFTLSPSLQSSLWSFSSPSVSYQQLTKSTWQHSNPGVNRDISNCQYGPVQHDLSQFCGTDLSHHWLTPDSSRTSIVDNAAHVSFRPVSKFDPVCDTVKCNAVQSGELSSCPTKHAYRYRSPTTNPGDYFASSDAELQSQKLEYAQDGTFSYQAASAAPIYPQTSTRGIHSCDQLDSGISLDELRTVQSECAAAGNTASSCRYSEEPFSTVTCKLDSVRCSSVEGLTEDCVDVFGGMATRLHHHHHHHYFHPVSQQPVFTNCRKTSFRSRNIVADSQQCARQSASMDDLDVIDLPCHSSFDGVQTDMVDNTVSAAAESGRSTHDAGCVASVKPDRAAAEMTAEKSRSNLNDQNCVEQDASVLLPSFCPKLPSSNRKSKKKTVQRATDEKLQPVVGKTLVCDDDNVAAYDGAIDNNSCTAASDRTARRNVESCIDDRTGKNNLVQEKTSKSESSSRTTRSVAGECSNKFSVNSAENDKLSHSSIPSHVHSDSRLRLEAHQTGLRHHRRTVRSKTSSRITALKQKSFARRDDGDHAQTSSSFPLKQFLLSVDWQQQQRNFGMPALQFVSTETNINFWFPVWGRAWLGS